jgi:ribosomal protein S18 acetylase RimI-like enzyme
VDGSARGRRLGEALLRFCIELAEQLREEFGCVGLLVDAKPDAVTFYKRFGFQILRVVEGSTEQKPIPTPMFLALGSVPPRRG